MGRCDAKIRPFPNDTELQCDGELDTHLNHEATLRDYAFPGSVTTISWFDLDRRTFRGDWAPCSATAGCVLPHGHHGRCEQ